METLFLAFITAAGFVILWIKILGTGRALRFQVIGDILITGLLIYLGRDTYSGMVLACVTGFLVSFGLLILKQLMT